MKPVIMTREEWEAEGTRRFGPDKMGWKFVCPICGQIATTKDWKKVGAPEGAVAFSCIGRWMEKQSRAFGKKKTLSAPCDYTGGGLFRLNPVQVEGHSIFAFADTEAADLPP